MVTTLMGENSFALQQELNGLVNAFLKDNDELALERLDGQEADYARMHEALTSLPFLAVRKMVVLRAPGANKQFTEQLEHIIDVLPETTDLIIVETKPDKRLSYYKDLKKLTDLHEFTVLDQPGLVRWLTASAKRRGGSLTTSDAGYLVDRVGHDQQLLSNELDKLLLYDTAVSRQTIDLLTDTAPQSTVFQLLEAAFAGKRERAMELYSEQRSLKVEPVQIIAMLTWQLRVLAVLKTAGQRPLEQIAKEAKLNPYSLRKSQGIAQRLSLSQLKRLINDLLRIDMDSKRSALDPDEALQHYLLGLAG